MSKFIRLSRVYFNESGQISEAWMEGESDTCLFLRRFSDNGQTEVRIYSSRPNADKTWTDKYLFPIANGMNTQERSVRVGQLLDALGYKSGRRLEPMAQVNRMLRAMSL